MSVLIKKRKVRDKDKVRPTKQQPEKTKTKTQKQQHSSAWIPLPNHHLQLSHVAVPFHSNLVAPASHQLPSPALTNVPHARKFPA